MSFKREHVAKWMAREFPGDRFVTYVVTSTRGAGSVGVGAESEQVPIGGDAQRSALAESLGLDPGGRLRATHDETFWVLTDRQLVLGSRSAFRNRPKEVLRAAPIDGVRVWWFDSDPDAGNQFRHFFTDFGDGSWRGDRTGLTALGRELTTANAQEYVQVLGEVLGDRLRALDVS